MRRKTFTASVSSNGALVAEATTYAWNSAVRASEALVRELARSRGTTYTASLPVVEGKPGDGIYRRQWTGADGHTLTAEVSS